MRRGRGSGGPPLSGHTPRGCLSAKPHTETALLPAAGTGRGDGAARGVRSANAMRT